MTYDNAINDLILTIIQQNKIAEQTDLQVFLQQRGYNIPQATLSRRLKKLNVVKVSGIYQCIDFKMPNLPLILKIDISDFGLIVIHTHPGQASSLAYFLDQKYVNNAAISLLATIAGDDTILLISKNKDAVQLVLNQLQKDFPYLPNPNSIINNQS